MTATLRLTPAAGLRLYRGPRFHTARDRVIHDQIRNFKSSAEASIRYLGIVLEAIAKMKPQSA